MKEQRHASPQKSRTLMSEQGLAAADNSPAKEEEDGKSENVAKDVEDAQEKTESEAKPADEQTVPGTTAANPCPKGDDVFEDILPELDGDEDSGLADVISIKRLCTSPNRILDMPDAWDHHAIHNETLQNEMPACPPTPPLNCLDSACHEQDQPRVSTMLQFDKLAPPATEKEQEPESTSSIETNPKNDCRDPPAAASKMSTELSNDTPPPQKGASWNWKARAALR